VHCLHDPQHATTDISALKESMYGAAGSGPAAALENAAVAVTGSASQVGGVLMTAGSRGLQHSNCVLATNDSL
jgi:hypothetical protein